MKGIFKRVSVLIFVTVVLCSTLSHPVLAQGNDVKSIDYRDRVMREAQKPDYVYMGADILIARPLGVGATGVGAVLFVASLPFSLLGGNVKESFNQLVGVPANATFFRCLGCEG